jgi:hypothetical protein
MLSRICCLVAVVAVAMPARGQDQAGWAQQLLVSNGKAATEHDFGPVPKGALLQHRISVSNKYGLPLTIQLGVSCDCVKVSSSKAQLQPRETTTLDIEMDTRRFNGPKEVIVYFTVQGQLNGQPYFSTALVKLKAFCRTDVAMNPGVVNFNIVPRGEQRQSQIDVTYQGVLDWRITQAPANELFDVAVVEKFRQPGRVGYIVQMSLKGDAPAGSYKQELVLSTNDANAPILPIPFELTVQPPLAVLPETLRFGSARVGATAEQKLFVRSGGKPFKIIGVEGLVDGLTIAEPLPTEARPVHIITVKFAPTTAGPVNKKLKFLTDGGEGLSASCTVDCTVAAP